MQQNKSWLDRLPKNITLLKNKSFNKIKDMSNTYKKIVGTSICAAVLLTGIHTNEVNANDTSKISVDTIYHVYLDGDRIGSVDNSQLVKQLIDSKISAYNDDFEGLNLLVGQDIQLIKEMVFSARANNQLTLNELENKLTIKAEAVALMVEDKEVGYVSSKEDFEQVMKSLKLQYVTEEELAEVEKAKAENKEVSKPSVGDKQIMDVKLSSEIEIEKVLVNPDNVLSVSDAIKQLNLGTLEEDIYVVEPGDVLGAIAINHGLSMQEIISLNPGITEDTLLQIGDELNVTVYEPAVKVIVEEASKVKEEIPFQTETKEDSNMWKGDTKVQTAGQAGERVVSYNITRENGRTISRQIISEEVTKEPINRVVIKGTKVTPSRGSGTLSWPAVGGYISSYQGMRWGRLHKGIDIARPSNYNILAADNGTVTFAGWDGSYGNKVMINHNNGMTTLYAHLASMDVRVGQTVAKGQKIGVMGQTGNSTGIHLHFEVYQNGQLRNPMDYLRR